MAAAGGGLEIRAVADPAGIDLFHAAGLAARAAAMAAGSPGWAVPARFELRRIFAPTSPIMTENQVQPFVALRDGRPVGRIVATVNGAHAAKYADRTGHFGYLDAVPDPNVFAALTEAAAAWLKARGMARMQGPFSLSINHEAGLLVHGFDEPHFVRTNYAPPFYGEQLTALGFAKEIDLVAYAMRPRESDYPERVRALLARSPVGTELRTTGMTHRRWTTDARRINRLYNDAWAENWGSLPVSEAEADFIAALSRPVVKPPWLRIATHAGEDVALVGHLPDMNAVAPADGELFPFGWARLLGGLHVARPRRSRLAMIGVARRFRGTRIGGLAISLLMAEAIETARRTGIEEVEISWMLETNRAILNLVASLPARHTRTFRIFTKAL